MATMANQVKRPIRRSRKAPAVEVIHGNQTVPKDQAHAFLVAVSGRMNERAEREKLIRAMARRPAAGESHSLRFAMRAVEQRIVRGLWVLEISQSADGPREAKRNGLEYMRDLSDVDWRYADAPSGKWETAPPRPALPSSEEIDAAREAQGWISFLDQEQARFFTLAAMSKRGERPRRVNWERVFSRLPHLKETKLRTLQERYDQALRIIVAELTYARVA